MVNHQWWWIRDDHVNRWLTWAKPRGPLGLPHRCGARSARSTGAAWTAAVEAIVLLQQFPSAKAQLKKGGFVKSEETQETFSRTTEKTGKPQRYIYIYIYSDVPLPSNSDHKWTAQTEHHKNAPNWVYLWSEVPTYSHAQIRKHCFSTTPAEAPWCHQHRHGLSKQSSNGTCFVQALHYKVVLGSTLCDFVVQSSTEKYFSQALLYKVVLGNTFLQALCCTVVLGSSLWLCSKKNRNSQWSLDIDSNTTPSLTEVQMLQLRDVVDGQLLPSRRVVGSSSNVIPKNILDYDMCW